MNQLALAMKNQRAILLSLGLAWNTAAAGAGAQTNDVHQQALEVLRKTIESLEGGAKAAPQPPARPSPEPASTAVERLYLQGKITAKDFQRYLEQANVDIPALRNDGAPNPAIEALRNELSKAETNRATSPPPVPTPDGTPPKPGEVLRPALPEGALDVVPVPDPSTLEELEKKMDGLLRLKAARENAATNVVSNTSTNTAGPPPPKTKRERLDELLRLVIAGKLTDAEYKEQRAKIVAGPD